jgi:hypothetical protein
MFPLHDVIFSSHITPAPFKYIKTYKCEREEESESYATEALCTNLIRIDTVVVILNPNCEQE